MHNVHIKTKGQNRSVCLFLLLLCSIVLMSFCPLCFILMQDLFEKIARREIPSHIVWEDDRFIAFLSIGPFAKGHTLVIPKDNWGDYLFAIEDEQYASLMAASKQVAALLESKLSCDRVLMWVEGFEVPHVHIHLLPVQQGQGIRSLTPIEMSDDEFKAVAEQITS